MNKLKAFIWACQDKWDAFKEDPVKTHLACAVMGGIIGAFLAYR